MNVKQIRKDTPEAFKKLKKWINAETKDILQFELMMILKNERDLYDFFDSFKLNVLLELRKGMFRYYVFNQSDYEIKELWKPMKGYEKLYKVSNHGKIRSVSRRVRFGITFRVIKATTLQPAEDKQGYLFTYVSEKSVIKRKDIHREVAKCFILNFNEKLQVNHKDGIKRNNSIMNLEMVTGSENIKHAYENNLCNGNKVSGFKTRKEAENKAFLKAFKILEKQTDLFI